MQWRHESIEVKGEMQNHWRDKLHGKPFGPYLYVTLIFTYQLAQQLTTRSYLGSRRCCTEGRRCLKQDGKTLKVCFVPHQSATLRRHCQLNSPRNLPFQEVIQKALSLSLSVWGPAVILPLHTHTTRQRIRIGCPGGSKSKNDCDSCHSEGINQLKEHGQAALHIRTRHSGSLRRACIAQQLTRELVYDDAIWQHAVSENFLIVKQLGCWKDALLLAPALI